MLPGLGSGLGSADTLIPIHAYASGQYFAESKPVHIELKRKEIFRLSAFVREADVKTLECKPLPKKNEE